MLQEHELTLRPADPRDARSLVAEQILRVGPPAIFLADEIVERHLHVLEEDFVDLVIFVERDDRTHGDARRLHVDQEERDALLLFRGRIGAHEAEHHVGVLAERRPGLLAVDDVVIALAIGARSERREIGAGAGFRVSLAPPVGAVEDARQIVGLLRVAAVFHQHGRDHRYPERQHAGRSDARAFFVPDVALGGVPARAAIFRRPRDHRPAARAEQLVPARVVVAVQTFVFEDLVTQRVRQVGFEPGADVGAKCVVGGGIVQVHARCLQSHAWPASATRERHRNRTYCSGSFSAAGTGSGITSIPSSSKACASSGVVTPRMLRAGASL